MMNKRLILPITILISLLSGYSSITADFTNHNDTSEEEIHQSVKPSKEEEQKDKTYEPVFSPTDSHNSPASEQTFLERQDASQAENQQEDLNNNEEVIEALYIISNNLQDENELDVTNNSDSPMLPNPFGNINSSSYTSENYLQSPLSVPDEYTSTGYFAETTEILGLDLNEISVRNKTSDLSKTDLQATEEVLQNKSYAIENILRTPDEVVRQQNETSVRPENDSREFDNTTASVLFSAEELVSNVSEEATPVTEIPAETASPESVILGKTFGKKTVVNAQDTSSTLQVASPSTSGKSTGSHNERNMKLEKCYQYPKIKTCSQVTDAHMKHHGGWYYNPTEMQCQYTSDCIINDNVFEKKEKCSETCEYWRGTARCLGPPRAGHFRCSTLNPGRTVRPILMVYFDKVSGKCRWFTYYGCGGSANRFTSITECENTCGNLVAYKILLVANQLCQVAPTTRLFPQWSRIETDTWSLINQDDQFFSKEISESILFDNLTYIDAMRIEPECPNIGQHESRWYLDVETNQCQEFAYSHCGGSSNNFLTRADCEQFCGATKPDAMTTCKLIPLPGECTEYKSMWYYDPNWLTNVDGQDHQLIGGCRQFNYSGCGGNSNRFPTQAACEMTCQFNTKIELQIDVDSPEETTNVTMQNNPFQDVVGDPSTIYTMESNRTTISTLTRKMTKLTLMNIDLEPCRRHPVFGFCRSLNCSEEHKRNQSCHFLNFQRWFFNAHTSNCEAYNYSGCGASENSFDDAQACQAACKARIVRPDRDQRCDSNPHSKKCYTLSVSGNQQETSNGNDVIAFHFSMASATCKAFHLNTKRPGCSMEQYFPNGYDCLRACVKSSPTEKHLQNRCFARKTHVSWNCTQHSAKTYRWSYLPEINQCVRFSECTHPDQQIEQPGNNFASRSECETICMASSFEAWDICLDSHSYGTCSLSGGQYQTTSEYPYVPLTRYYYDRRLGQCQPYTYTGCGARGNHFDTLGSCQRICENRLRNPKFARCHFDKPVKQCPGSGIQAWAYNHSIGDCYFFEMCEPDDKPSELTVSEKRFSFRLRRTSQWLGVWQARTGSLPEGVYATRSACQYHCLPKPPKGTDTQNVCHMNPIVTVPYGCNAMVTRWYFEPRETQCRSYITCPQYGNNFPSHKACQDICTPGHPIDVCRLPHDHGGCSNFEKRWYYDLDKRMCMPFTYGGCFGNSNRFLTKAECEGFCMGKDICRLPLQKNSTDPSYPERFYYDKSKKQCLPFRFTGLLAHGNNFPTLAACNSACISVPDIEVIAERNVPSYNLTFSRTSEEKLGALVKASSSTDPLSIHKLSESEGTVNDILRKTSDSDNFAEKFPCLPFLTGSQYDEMVKQTFCNPEDIIHELGYRFQVRTSVHLTDEKYDGICVPVLVPICLNEPKSTFGQFTFYESQMIGRVFKTEAECEATCLLRNRFRRNIMKTESHQLPDNVLLLLVDILKRKNTFTANLSVGYELKTDKSHEEVFQAFTVPLNQPNIRRPLLLEVIENEQVNLPCWVISPKKPTVQWIHLLSRKRYPVEVDRHPLTRNIWISHLLLQIVKTQVHTGGWICEAFHPEFKVLAKSSIILNVISMGESDTLTRKSQDPVLLHKTLIVPQDGLVLLYCPISQYSKPIIWKRADLPGGILHFNELISKASSEYLVIERANVELHSGIWICGVQYNNNFTSMHEFNVSIGYPPEFQNKGFNLPGLLAQHLISCPIFKEGLPKGQVKWFQCKHMSDCHPVKPHSVKLAYLPSENITKTVLCCIENMWGRDEKYFKVNL
ncbi:unnamed protein product [Heterobilharzia americana]|nr:unnamed protein product [Heterobilharzia americana]